MMTVSSAGLVYKLQKSVLRLDDQSWTEDQKKQRRTVLSMLGDLQNSGPELYFSSQSYIASCDAG
jgi:hypothetical protein